MAGWLVPSGVICVVQAPQEVMKPDTFVTVIAFPPDPLGIVNP